MKDFYKKESPILTLPSLAGGFQGGAGESDPWAHVIGNQFGDDYPGQMVLDSSRNIIFTMMRTGSHITVKLSNSGAILWKRKLNMGTDYSSSFQQSDVTVDSSDNVYVAFTTTSNYSSVYIPVSNTQGAGNIIVAKYNSSGVLQWQREITTSTSTATGNAGGIACDSSDNVYVCGTQMGYNQSTSAYQIYALVKFNSSGTHQWTERLQGYKSSVTAQNRNAISQYHRANGLTYVPAASGQPEGVCMCCTMQNYDSQSSSRDFFIARYDTSGNIQWRNCYRRNVNNSYKDEGPSYGYNSVALKSITSDSSGNIFAIGTCNNSLQFNSAYPSSQMLFKLDPSGSVTWSKKFGFFKDRGAALAVSPSTGQIVAVGNKQVVHSYEYASNGNINVYDSSGSPQRSFNLSSGGSGTYNDYNRINYCGSVAADNKDFFYLLAVFQSVTGETSNPGQASGYQCVVLKLALDFTVSTPSGTYPTSGHPSLAGYNGSYSVEPHRWGIRHRGGNPSFPANPSFQFINGSGGISVFDQSTGGYPSGARMKDTNIGAITLPIATSTLTDEDAQYTTSFDFIAEWPPAPQ